MKSRIWYTNNPSSWTKSRSRGRNTARKAGFPFRKPASGWDSDLPLLVELSPRALRDLKALEIARAGEILDDLKILQSRPWPGPPKVKKLEGYKNLYRLRTGNY